jgi:hypothetical protein
MVALLSARRERPNGRSTSKEGNEIASLHGATEGKASVDA